MANLKTRNRSYYMYIIDDKNYTLSLSTHFSYFIFYLVIFRMVLLHLILILINVIQIDSTLDSCRQTFGSNKYDLNRLSDLTILGDDSQGFKYAFTPCGLVPINQCGQGSIEPGMTACQVRGTTFESSMGFLDGYGKSPNIEFSENPAGPGTGVLMTMDNARCSGGQRLVRVTFTCDESAKNPTRMEVVEF